MTKKNERIYIRFEINEKNSVEEKAKKYKFTNVSEYIRWCSLNERLIVEDLAGKQEAFDKIGELYLLIKEYVREQNYLLKHSLFSMKDKEKIKDQNEDVLRALNLLCKTVVKSLKKTSTMQDVVYEEEEGIEYADNE